MDVVATDSGTPARTGTAEVTINVTNVDEPGTINLSSDSPGLNAPLAATLTDPDGSISNTAWQWAERTTQSGSTWQNISGATSNSYTPTQTGRYLRVTAEYDDGEGNGKSAVREIAFSVINNPPTFGDNPTAISIQENNAEGASVGNPISASDANGDALTFSLRDTTAGSRHAKSFSIDQSGQISVAPGVQLDHEGQETYLITIDVTDGRDADGNADTTTDISLELTIIVTDANDPGMVTFSNPYPQLGLAITAELADDQDDYDSTTESWQWAHGESPTGPWINISNATLPSYTPESEDEGKYLRATVTYTDNTYGAGESASAITKHPVDQQITLVGSPFDFYTFENSIKGAPLGGNPPTTQDASGMVEYSLEGGDHSRYTIDSKGEIRVESANLDHESDDSDSFTIRVRDESGATATATVNVEIKDLIEDDEEFTLMAAGDTITWTRVAETNFLLARAQGQEGPRRPEYELNAQLIPCFRELRPDWETNDEYQLDMWLDGEILKYRDPDRSQLWTAHGITVPDPDHARGTDPQCPPGYTDIWNDHSSIYALDTGHRLIKAYNLDVKGTTYTRDPSRDIPLSQDHYRSTWEVQGTWGDQDTIWVSYAEQTTNEGLHAKAYDRTNFKQKTGQDIKLSGPETEYVNLRLIDTQKKDGVLWIIDNDNQGNVFGRSPEDVYTVMTCSDGNTENSIGAYQGLTQQPLRLTGQGDLLYTLNHESQKLDTYSTKTCPPAKQLTEFDFQDIPDKPFPHASGIATDDGLVMYFGFFVGEIRHISKLLPTLVKDSHIITIRENTQDTHDSAERKAGEPFRVESEQVIGDYTWYLEETGDNSNYTRCGETPADGHTSDAVPFDCRSSGSRGQSFQLLTRESSWFDHEKKNSYDFTLRVKDVDGDTDTFAITVRVEDVDERPAKPDQPAPSGVGQQSITIGWNQVTKLVENATPRTETDQITGYVIEYAQAGEDPQVEPVPGGDTVTHQLNGLHTNTSYSVRLRAINGHGEGPWSPWASTRTLPNPGPSLDSTSFSINENTPLVDDPDTGTVEALAEVETLIASDTDDQDAITGYEILQVGSDRASFQLTPAPTAAPPSST